MGGALALACLLRVSDARARDIAYDEAGFAVTLALPAREPGCIVLPEAKTVAKDCAGIDLARLRGSREKPDAFVEMVAYVTEDGVVFVRVEYHPQPDRAYPTRQTLEAWAAEPVASAVAAAPGVSASGEVVELAGVASVHARVVGDSGGRRLTTRFYRVPAPKGLVEVAFVAMDGRAEPEMNRFADATIATLRVGKPPTVTVGGERPSDETDWATMVAAVALAVGVLGGVGWLVTRKKTKAI